MVTKRKNVDTLVEARVAHYLIENPDYTGKDLKKKVEISLKPHRYNFTERTYQNIKADLAPNMAKNGPLDSPWSIGSCKEFDIPGEAIAVLMDEIEEFGSSAPTGPTLTNRQAQWAAKLYPVVSRLAQTQYPDNRKRQRACLLILAKQYAHRERISKALGKDYADTADLDEFHFIKEKLSEEGLNDAMNDYIFPEQIKDKDAQQANEWPGHPKANYEKVLCAPLDDGQVDILNQWLRLGLQRNGTSLAKHWQEDHPDIAELLRRGNLTKTSMLKALNDLNDVEFRDGEK